MQPAVGAAAPAAVDEVEALLVERQVGVVDDVVGRRVGLDPSPGGVAAREEVSLVAGAVGRDGHVHARQDDGAAAALPLDQHREPALRGIAAARREAAGRRAVGADLDHLAGEGLDEAERAVGQQHHAAGAAHLARPVAFPPDRAHELAVRREDRHLAELGVEHVDRAVRARQNRADAAEDEVGLLAAGAPGLLHDQRLQPCRRLGGVLDVRRFGLRTRGRRRPGQAAGQSAGQRAGQRASRRDGGTTRTPPHDGLSFPPGHWATP